MAQKVSRTPLEGLKHHYERTQTTCSACGFEDEEVVWAGVTDGASARYRHECPSCGAVEERTVQFSK